MNRAQRRALERKKLEFVARMQAGKDHKRIVQIMDRMVVKAAPEAAWYRPLVTLPDEHAKRAVAQWEAKKAARIAKLLKGTSHA